MRRQRKPEYEDMSKETPESLLLIYYITFVYRGRIFCRFGVGGQEILSSLEARNLCVPQLHLQHA